MADNLGLSRIGQIAVPVADLDRAIAFYRDTLGMTFLFRAPPGLAFFDCSGVRLMLDLPEAGQDGRSRSGSIIYYRVPDIQATYGALKSRGVLFVDEPHRIARMPDHELWMCFLKDTEGNTLGLMAEKPLRA